MGCHVSFSLISYSKAPWVMQHGQFCRVANFAARWRSVFVFLRSRPRASGRRGWVALVSAILVVSVRPRWNELPLHV